MQTQRIPVLLKLCALAVLAMVVGGVLAGPKPVEGAFPGANGKIAFRSLADVWVVNLDGTALQNLTNDGFGPCADDTAPAWSPDGSKIAFSTSRDCPNREIYLMNADGSGQTNLTNNAAADRSPAWSPDGTKIAFARRVDPFVADDDIYVMNADGSGTATNLTNNSQLDSQATWSPDGTKIAFVSNRDGNVEVYVMNADGSGQINLTSNAADDLLPDWSPDGSQIAFYSDRDGNLEIYVMNADGSGQTNLTNDAALDAHPAWSPDGSKIAFVSDRDQPLASPFLYVMNSDGTNPSARVVNIIATFPDWQPLVSQTPVGPPDATCPIPNFPFSAPGCDNFDSRWAVDVLFTNPPLAGLACSGAGPTQVVRYQDPFAPTDTDADTLRDFETEITFMLLEGTCQPGNVPFAVHQSATVPSTGLVEEQSVAKGGDGAGGNFFPANSFFDVFFEVDTPLGTLHNNSALRMECKVSAIPPVDCSYVPQPGDIDLFDGTEKLVGVLTHGSHDPHAVDSDFDGCSDDQEGLSKSQATQGGGRNPLNYWDFYDTNRDGIVDLFNDIVGVIQRFGANDDGGSAEVNRNTDPFSPPPEAPAYHPTFDRGPSSGPNPWNMTAPDGVIDLFNDIVGVISQFGHDCR